jgi:hypothetical protein
MQEQDFVQIKDYSCRLIDIAICKSGLGLKLYLSGVDIFAEVKKDCMYHGDALVPQTAVSIEEGDLLEISDDGHYSVMGKDNSVADNMKIYREDLAKR